MDQRLTEIMEEIYIALERLRAEEQLLETVESFGSGLTDEEVLNRLRQINARDELGPWQAMLEER